MLTDQELQSLRNLGNEYEAAADEIAMMRLALLRCVENVERWLRTDKAASPEESRSIYEQMCEALGRAPIDPNALTDEELADCGLLSELKA